MNSTNTNADQRRQPHSAHSLVMPSGDLHGEDGDDEERQFSLGLGDRHGPFQAEDGEAEAVPFLESAHSSESDSNLPVRACKRCPPSGRRRRASLAERTRNPVARWCCGKCTCWLGGRTYRWQWIILSILVLLLAVACLAYWILVPAAIQHAITRVPPIAIERILVERLHGNQSISLCVNGHLEGVQVPRILEKTPMRFLPATYNFSILARPPRGQGRQASADTDTAWNLGWLDLNSLRQWESEFRLDGFALFHDLDRDKVKQIVDLAAVYLRSLLHRPAPPPLKSDDEKEYSLAVDGLPTARFLGLDFHRIPLHHEIPLKWDVREYYAKMEARIVDCKIDNVEEIDCMQFLGGNQSRLVEARRLLDRWQSIRLERRILNRQRGRPVGKRGANYDARDYDDDDDDENLQLRVTISMLNPTTLGLHLGSMQATFHHLQQTSSKLVEIATAQIPDLDFRNTMQSPTLRQNVTVLVTPTDPFAALKVLNEWKAGKKVTMAMLGRELKFGGYPLDVRWQKKKKAEKKAEKTEEDLAWFEGLLEDFHLEFQLPSPPEM